MTLTTTTTGSIKELIELTEHLTAVIAEESEILGSMKSFEIGSLQAEKESLSRAYSAAVGAADSIVSKPASTRLAECETLARVTARLQDITADNLHAVTIARTFNERLVRALSEAVTESRHPATAYTADGQRLFTMSHITPTAMTLDDRI